MFGRSVIASTNLIEVDSWRAEINLIAGSNVGKVGWLWLKSDRKTVEWGDVTPQRLHNVVLLYTWFDIGSQINEIACLP